MENTDRGKESPIRNNPGRVWVPLGLVFIGTAMFLRQMSLGIPSWLFSWQMLLIAVGIFTGLAHSFRGPGWLVMILIGSFFMIDQIIPGFDLHRFLWPIILVSIGFIMLVRPKKNGWRGNDPGWCRNRQRRRDRFRNRWENKRWDFQNQSETDTSKGSGSHFGSEGKSFSSEDYIDSTTAFGGIHKNIVSKNFKGGDIVIFMGGAEINLSQADIQGTAVLDIVQVMGGTKIVIPSNWEIRSDITSIFGNIEDKRQNITTTDHNKVLIIDGFSIFGGIEIRSF